MKTKNVQQLKSPQSTKHIFILIKAFLDSHKNKLRLTESITRRVANCVLRGFGANQLSNFVKCSTAIRTCHSCQLSSFPIIENRRPSRPGLRLYCSIFLPLLINMMYDSFRNVFLNSNLCCRNVFGASSKQFFLFEKKLNEPFYGL